MASIGQIVKFMNDQNSVWHPKDIVDVELSGKCNYGFESYPHGRIASEEDKLFIRYDSQKHIGHFYIWYNMGNGSDGIILLPLNTGRYLKADYNPKQ